jgi:hypothetical protein
MNRTFAWNTAAFALALWTHAASGQSFSSGSSGADGVFAPTASQNLTVRPGGVYNYTTVTIPANVTVRYFKNTDNAPVVILATGDVTIEGSIVVSGIDGGNNSQTPQPGGQGGPGGFAGGMSGYPTGGFVPTSGQGPGGGASAGNVGMGGVYGAPTSFVGLTPLFGGSGGGAGVGFFSGGPSSGAAGGGGGGAILIASSTRIQINGRVLANGGLSFGGVFNCATQGGPGSGGAIRLVAPAIGGFGQNSMVQAIAGAPSGTPCGNAGSVGRIRMEAFNMSGFNGLTDPVPSVVNAPGPVSPGGNPALANVPTLAIASVGGQAVPATPLASYSVPDMTLPAGTANPVPVLVNVTNTPVGSPTEITLRLLPRSGGTGTVAVAATNHTGTFASSSATANVTLSAGQVTVLQASAAMTLTGQTASLFPLIDGEPVERVEVAATPGQPSTLSLVTKSGKERRLDEMPIEDQMRVAQAWEAMKNSRTE